MQTETTNHPLVNFYLRKKKMTKIQSSDYFKNNLLNNNFELKGKIRQIDSTRLVIEIQYGAYMYEHDNLTTFSVCFKYDASFASKLLNFNLEQYVVCKGKLIGDHDCDFTMQLNEISAYQPIQTESSNNSNCFIATACFGDYNSKEVVVLREFRDNVLLNSSTGKFLVKFYYFVSPPIAKIIEKSSFLKTIIRNWLLLPFIRKLKKQ